MPEAEKRVGRQFPTQSVVLPYTQTKGGEAILLYDQSSRKTMEWLTVHALRYYGDR